MPLGNDGMNPTQDASAAQGEKQVCPTPDELYTASPGASLVQQSSAPASFCSQQSPHRVQSSTNLDLVDCVGSDLLLAMNNLDVGEQARAAAAAAASATNRLFAGAAENAETSPTPHVEGFLPLAALAPPPTRQPAWLTAQQQQARVQNEHFPARIYGSHEHGGAGDQRQGERGRGDSLGHGGGIAGIRGEDSLQGEYEYDFEYTNGSAGTNGNGNGNGGSRGSPGAVPPPGFGIGPGGGTPIMDQRNSSRGPSTNSSGCVGGGSGGAAGGRGRRPRSTGENGTPHLDESWTAVLNAPAGAELMEFLTERASRALVLWNVESVGEDELRAACEAHGPLYYLRAEHRRKSVVFLAYYDVRDAADAHRSLGQELARHLMNDHCSRPSPAVHFSIELHAGFSYKEGSLVVHDLPPQATEEQVGAVFQRYGDLRGVVRHPTQHQAHPAIFSVEFCSIQDARVAAQELTARNPWGHAVTVEPAMRSESERALGRRLHATLNRWTAEATAAQASAAFAERQHLHQHHQHHQHQIYHHKHRLGMLTSEDRMRSGSSSIVLSGRSSDSDSPPPKPEDYPRELGHMMDSYTPMTSANTTPATTPGSTPPSGAEVYHGNPDGAPGQQSQAMQQQQQQQQQQHQQQHQYICMHQQQHQHYSRSAGPSPSSCRGMQLQHHRLANGSGGGSASAGPHPMYPSSAKVAAHRSHGSGHHPGSRMPPPPPPLHGNADVSAGGVAGAGAGAGAAGSGYYYEVSPAYHADREDDRTPPTPMWASSLSLSPPSSKGMRGSVPMRGVAGGMMGAHTGGGVGPGGAGGLGYKDRSRQTSLDEGTLGGGGVGTGGGGGGRSMRCSSDSTQMLVSPGPTCGGSGGGDEFSLDLKKVSKGLDKRTTIMIRNIPNKYTQAMLLQEIDASYRGAYDFFYLPIDFKNKCNVGYAFINFMDYRRIVPFFREFNGQRWKNFNSEKVCAISYARIQGKASMISRFQNSSLMEKDGEYRPLIFHSSGSERGRPEPFPASSKVFRGISPAMSGAGFGRDRERSMSASSTLA